MPEYVFKGSQTQTGVDFFITAENMIEAREKAKRGEYDFTDTGCAELSNWDIKPGTGELNE